MNLKKLAWSALLSPIMVLSGCAGWKPYESIMVFNSRKEWKSDEQLIQNIWKEVVKITEIEPNTPMPKIEFLKNADPEAYERFYGKDRKDRKIETYLGSIWETISEMQDAYDKSGAAYGCNINYKEREAFIYSAMAHGMLHDSLWLKRVPKNSHHRQMKEKGYFLSVSSYINDYFKINTAFKSNRNGCQVKILMKSLDIAIKNDEKEISEQKKK